MLGWILRRLVRLTLFLLLSPLFLLRGLLDRLVGRDLLVLRVTGAVPDLPIPEPPWRRFVPRKIPVVSLEELLLALNEVERDPRIRGVLLMLDRAGLSLVQGEELLEAVDRVRRADTRVLVWSEGLSGPALMVSAAGDRALSVPEGQLEWLGIRARAVFVHDLLELLGVVPELGRHGDYKTMADTFNRRTMSAAQREMLEDLGGDLYEQVITPCIVGRQLEREVVVAAVDEAPLANRSACERGLLDGVAYRDELEEAGGRLLSLEEGRTPSTCALPRLLARRRRREWLGAVLRDPPRVRIVQLAGNIVSGEIGRGIPSLATVRALDAAREDRGVAAVVLRIDSPGGSALASDEIWRAVKRLDAEKPVVASLGRVAASGGYYAAVGARRIVAHAATLTGSIGIVSGKFQVAPALFRWGVRVEGIAFGQRAGMLDPDLPLDEGMRAGLQRELMRFYWVFVDRVAQGRGMSREEVDAVAQGRVYTGRRALGLKLVDELGGIRRAIRAAGQAAQLDRTPVLELVNPSRRGALAFLDAEARSGTSPGLEGLGAGLAALESAARLVQEPALAYCPWRVDGT